MTDERRKTKFYKRRLLINNRLQLSILYYTLTQAMGLSAITILVRTVKTDDILYAPGGKTRLILMVAFGILIMALLSVYGMYLSNKIAGPIFRLMSHMQDMADGKPAKTLSFRKGDFFSEVLGPYNKLVERIHRSDGGHRGDEGGGAPKA